jgi:hypothetical protein
LPSFHAHGGQRFLIQDILEDTGRSSNLIALLREDAIFVSGIGRLIEYLLIGDLKFGILAQAKQIQRSIINAARGGNLAGDVIRKEEATAFGSVIFHLVGRLRPQFAMRTRDLIIINTNNFCTHQ